ncbi:hypothetical protein V6N11_019939 [Hibiscus sabdariffa]|uniref:Uncharacterized protein n=2 Tax=Hibiscus sabdariffa TaxID=183260 RepID=A0ABR1ZL43_9ROSI
MHGVSDQRILLHSRSGELNATDFSRFFKTRCPDAYSYPQDDPTSTFTCPGGVDYSVVFCPTGSPHLEMVGSKSQEEFLLCFMLDEDFKVIRISWHARILYGNEEISTLDIRQNKSGKNKEKLGIQPEIRKKMVKEEDSRSVMWLDSDDSVLAQSKSMNLTRKEWEYGSEESRLLKAGKVGSMRMGHD